MIQMSEEEIKKKIKVLNPSNSNNSNNSNINNNTYNSNSANSTHSSNSMPEIKVINSKPVKSEILIKSKQNNSPEPKEKVQEKVLEKVLSKVQVNNIKKDLEEEETKNKPITANFNKSRSANLYLERKLVGEGTFGKVYKALYKNYLKQLDPFQHIQYMALKKLKLDPKQGFMSTALREIEILKKISHKNVLSLLEIVNSKCPEDVKEKEGSCYLVFEYFEHDLNGLSLSNFMFSESEVKYILHNILSGIEYLHTKNIMHRDIKGSNILLSNNWDIKIADFGSAVSDLYLFVNFTLN